MDLDPVFVRALRLLHSRSKDSPAQLRAMIDECFRQSHSPHTIAKGGSHSSSSSSSSSTVKKESDNKRSLDKLVRDLSELVPSSKKSRMDSPGSTKSHTPSPAPTSPGFSFEKGSTGSQSVQSGSSSSAEELDVDLNLEGLNDLTCFVCKSFNQENGNKLMECHTCQNLYHQECHLPAVSNDEAADPRLVWNCSDCSKTIKKVAPLKPVSSTALTSKSAKSSSSSGSNGGSGLAANLKAARASPSKLDSSSSNSVFKRIEQKGSGTSGVGSGKPAGMAALAASYKSNLSAPVVAPKVVAPPSRSGRAGPGGSSSSSSSSSTASSAASTLMTADKRLQMMKKKAAAHRKVR